MSYSRKTSKNKKPLLKRSKKPRKDIINGHKNFKEVNEGD